MYRYLIRRLLMVVPVLFGISLIVFFIMTLIPGDPAQAILGSYATPENLEKLRAEMGLDRSPPERYLLWLGRLVRGDLGRSYSRNRPVAHEVGDRLGPTLLLAGTALILCTLFGVGAGVIAAVYQYGWPDRIITLLVLVGISTPAFWLGLLFILLFSVKLGWLPVSGMTAVYGGGGPLDVLRHLALPAVTLAAVAAGILGRLGRTSMLEVLRKDFIRTARAKGAGEGRVVFLHALRNALVTLVPAIGVQAGFVLGGAVYVETVFQWPGIGRMLVEAINARDVLLVQGGVLVVAVCYVLLNLLADLIQHLLDPRIAT